MSKALQALIGLTCVVIIAAAVIFAVSANGPAEVIVVTPVPTETPAPPSLGEREDAANASLEVPEGVDLSRCETAPPAVVDAISVQLINNFGPQPGPPVFLDEPMMVKSNGSDGVWFVAGKVLTAYTAPESIEIGLWAVKEIDAPTGEVWSVNSYAREYSTWPGSYDMSIDGAEEAVGCTTDALASGGN